MKPYGLVFVVGFGCAGIATRWTIASEWIFVRKICCQHYTRAPNIGLHWYQFGKYRIIGIVDNAGIAVYGLVEPKYSLV